MRVLYNQRRCDDTHNSFSLAHSRISSNRKFGFISTDRSEQKKFTRFCFTEIKTSDWGISWCTFLQQVANCILRFGLGKNLSVLWHLTIWMNFTGALSFSNNLRQPFSIDYSYFTSPSIDTGVYKHWELVKFDSVLLLPKFRIFNTLNLVSLTF